MDGPLARGELERESAAAQSGSAQQHHCMNDSALGGRRETLHRFTWAVRALRPCELDLQHLTSFTDRSAARGRFKEGMSPWCYSLHLRCNKKPWRDDRLVELTGKCLRKQVDKAFGCDSPYVAVSFGQTAKISRFMWLHVHLLFSFPLLISQMFLIYHVLYQHMHGCSNIHSSNIFYL